MPQNPIRVQPVAYPRPVNTLNISVATVVKAAAGTVLAVSVVTAGSTPGSLNDVATNAPVAANKVATLPNAVGPMVFGVGFAFETGILVVPGTDQVVAITYQ